MFQSKDGKKFGSAFVAKRRDAEHDKASQMGKEVMDQGDPGAKEPTTENQMGSQEESGMQSPEQVVAEHGKATSVHLTHDHKNNKHKVTSTHESGHVHESDHASAKEAHDAGSALGGGSEQPMEQENEAPEPDGFSMPKLA